MRLLVLSRTVTAIGVLASASLAVADNAARPIIQGTPVGAEDRSVVALADQLGTVYCSGTLISPRVVLTAAHCLGQRPAFVFVGTDSRTDGVFLEVAGALAHPDHDGIAAADLAIVWLDRGTPIPPASIAARPVDDDDLGEPLRFVGFGDTGTYGSGIFGIKHEGTTQLTGFDEEWISYGVAGCHGDSGGPAFLSRDGGEVLAGITSHGDPDCAVGGFSTRVDRYAEWILAKVQELDAPACTLDGRCASDCTQIDLDCAVDAALDEPIEPDPVVEATGCSSGRGGGLGVGLVLLSLVRRRRRTKVALICALACAGCATDDSSDSERTFCRVRPIGDDTRAPEIAVYADEHRVADGGVVEVDGIATLGVHARNVDGCAVAVRVAGRSLSAPDRRISAGLIIELQDTDGWGVPPPAPSSQIELPVDGDYYVVVAVEDANGKAATMSMRVTAR